MIFIINTSSGLNSITSNSLFSHCYEGVINSQFFRENADARDFRTFDAKGSFTLAGIFAGSYLLGGEDLELIQPESFAELTSDGRAIPLGSREQTAAGASGDVEYTRWHEDQLAEFVPLQTKAGAWDASVLLNTSSRRKTYDADLVVVASLVDNAFNLGGISRVSEIMGVRELCLDSKGVMKTNEFASVSVHSEAWLDIKEVPIAGIAAYLRRMRAEGYTAVGVEQTDRSVVLGDEQSRWRFPTKTVLLLGTEKFGIPPELLGELDACVEIPQSGFTRSMNVQTAAAVVLYECCRQFRARPR